MPSFADFTFYGCFQKFSGVKFKICFVCVKKFTNISLWLLMMWMVRFVTCVHMSFPLTNASEPQKRNPLENRATKTMETILLLYENTIIQGVFF